MSLNIKDMIKKKAEKLQLTEREIKYFVQSCVNRSIEECQIGATLMAMYLNGLSQDETYHLTMALATSGRLLHWAPKWSGMLVDKHSTGGVGDKVSIALVPALAACGLKVPMISGKSLGSTGGTLDKLQSIPGFQIHCTSETLETSLENAGCFIAGATEDLCPGDSILYNIRDATATVDNIELMLASIISKKFASGANTLVVDVKVGKGAHLKTEDEALKFSERLAKLCNKIGVKIRIVLSRMNAPVGYAVGNSLEIIESVQCLQAKGPVDLENLVAVLGGCLLKMSEKVKTQEEGEQFIRLVLKNGTALKHFYQMLLSQGVSEKTADSLCYGDAASVLPSTCHVTRFSANAEGWIKEIDASIISRICSELGAGRKFSTDSIDLGTGIRLLHLISEHINFGENWIEVHHRQPTLDQYICDMVNRAIVISENDRDHSDSIVIGILT